MMKNLIKAIKRNIRALFRKIVGMEGLERRISRLEEMTKNIDAGIQVENGLRYLDRIQTTYIIDDKEKQEPR